MSIFQIYDTGRILFCQFRVMGNHNNKAIAGHFLQKLHDRNTGIRIQCAGWFICQQDIRVIDERSGYGNPLHLTAGHLRRLLMKLLSQPNLFQSLRCPPPSLGTGNTADR